MTKVRGDDEAEAQRAMETICRNYWYPIYAFLRRSGYSPSDAEDLTQGFFHRLISEEAILRADQERGRLRSYLLGVLKRFLSDEQRFHGAIKRGGKQRLISLDELAAEDRYREEPSGEASPAELFDRAWARRLLVEASERLRVSFVEGSNEDAYTYLSEFLPLGDNARSYRDVAIDLGTTEGTVRLQVHRMRQRYRKLILEEVAQTVLDAAEVEAELEYLMAVVGG